MSSVPDEIEADIIAAAVDARSDPNGLARRITRPRRLTPQEAATYDDLREKIEQEKPEIMTRIRSQLAELRK